MRRKKIQKQFLGSFFNVWFVLGFGLGFLGLGGGVFLSGVFFRLFVFYV